jgi:hypothetical protein
MLAKLHGAMKILASLKRVSGLSAINSSKDGEIEAADGGGKEVENYKVRMCLLALMGFVDIASLLHGDSDGEQTWFPELCPFPVTFRSPAQ